MAVEWEVSKITRTCSVTERELEVGETCFSALKEEDEGFARKDFSEDAWNDADKSAFFSFWRSRIPSEDEKKKQRLVIDTEAFYTFFAHLEGTEEPTKQIFHYVLGLILVRKRVLRLEAIEQTPEGEILSLFDRREDKTIPVFSPHASEEQLREAQETLNQIFDCQITADEM